MKNKRNTIAFAVLIVFFLCSANCIAEANSLAIVKNTFSYADDFLRGIFKYGDDAARIATHYGDDAAKMLIHNTDDTVKVIGKTLPQAVKKGDSIAGLVTKEALKPKTILAVGAAVSMPIASNQLSKGHSEALMEAAKRDPSIMGSSFEFITTPSKYFIFGLGIIVLFFVAATVKRKLSKKLS